MKDWGMVLAFDLQDQGVSFWGPKKFSMPGATLSGLLP